MQEHSNNTPAKSTSLKQTPKAMYSQSSRKKRKVIIGWLGQGHREYFKVANQAPMLIVPIISHQHNPGIVCQEIQEELKRVKEQRVRQYEYFNARVNEGQLRKELIWKLVQSIEAKKEMSQLCRQKLMRSNALKEEAWRQKEEHQYLSSELAHQADQTMVYQERQVVILNHSYERNEKEFSQQLRQKQLASREFDTMRKEQAALEQETKKQCQKSKQKQALIQQINNSIAKLEAEVKAGNLHVSILRLQISPKLRIGFSSVSLNPEEDRMRILDKGTLIWPRSKARPFHKNQLRDSIVIQLYPQWMKMLNKMSSDFIGYQQILCYSQPQEVLDRKLDLSLYLPRPSQVSKQLTVSKAKTVLVLYSPIEHNMEQVVQTILDLAGLENGIIRIYSATKEVLESGREEIQIDYCFQGTDRIRKIEVVRLKQLSRESLLKSVPLKQDKTVMVKIEIPLICESLAQKKQYEEVYSLLCRWK